MKTTLILIRHAEVENPKDIEYIRLPGFGLSKAGREQSKALKKILSKKNISIIYSSPLERAKETAQILADSKIPIKYSQKLTEANYHRWEGLKRNKRPAKELSGYRLDPVKYSKILGESLVDVQKRVLDELFLITTKHKGKTVAVVFHADPIITARLYFEGKPLSELMKTDLKHASTTSITLNDELKCEKVEYKEYVKAKGWRK